MITTTFTQATVRDAMQLGLFECEPDADLMTLARSMAEHHIHSVVVIGIERRGQRGERLSWGIVSDLDLVRALRHGPEETTARELAATDVVTVGPDDTLQHAAELMAELGTAHLVVASPTTHRPVGMLSTLDVARVAAGR